MYERSQIMNGRLVQLMNGHILRQTIVHKLGHLILVHALVCERRQFHRSQLKPSNMLKSSL